MFSPIRILLATVAISLVAYFAADAMAGPAPACDTTPPADWETPAGGEAEDVLGGEAESDGTATVTNDGPGNVEVSTPAAGGGTNTVTVPPGKTKHIQVQKGEKVDITNTESSVEKKKSAKGTVTFTSNCSDAGSSQPV